MRRSKLEVHIDILRALIRFGPLKLTHIIYKANVNCITLKEYLDFLMEHSLVEERPLPKRRQGTTVIYAITERGLLVLKCFRELDNVLHITNEKRNIPGLLF